MFDHDIDVSFWTSSPFKFTKNAHLDTVDVEIDKTNTLSKLMAFIQDQKMHLVSIDPLQNHLEQLLSEQSQS
jgi:hypothetical protein